MEFSIRSVRVRLGFMFFAGATALLCFNVGYEIQFGVLFSLLHEGGHLLAMCFSGDKPQEIRLGLFGMTIVRKNDVASYKSEIVTALAGPTVNYALALKLIIIYYAFGKNNLMITAAAVNIILGTFNIMPVFALDGGRALECCLKTKYPESTCETIMKTVSLVFLTAMMFMGFMIFIKSGYNFTLLAISVYLTIMLFIKT